MTKSEKRITCDNISIIVIVVCLFVFSGGCRGFSVGPRNGLFGIPIEFSKRNHLPKSSLDDLHEAMIANDTVRVAEHTAVPVADEWYVGSAEGEGQHRMRQDSGITLASYTQRDREPEVVNAAMMHKATPGQPNCTLDVPIPLEQDIWVANLELERYRDGKTNQPPESPWRWRHRGIEEILALPPEQQPDWQALLRHENVLVRGNALITLARSGDSHTSDLLYTLVNDVSRSRAMRCAAVEALASLPSTPPEMLIQLSDTYSDYIDANGNRKGGVPELAIEVLYAMAAKMPMANEPCFMRPLESRDPKVRLAAVSIWRDNAPQQPERVMLPDCVAQYCGNQNTAIQEAALIAVVRWRHPQAVACLDLGLRNPIGAVRIAAIRGLGILQTHESVVMLMSLLNDPSKAIRAEVVTALGQVGLQDKVYQMSGDADWEVRRAVARELAKSNNPQTQAIAKKYLRDRSVQVQQATLDSLRHWHPESTAALLFEAMDSSALETRNKATEMLAQYWEPARQYQPNGRVEIRKQHYRQLASQFQNDMQTGVLQTEIAKVLNGLQMQPSSPVTPFAAITAFPPAVSSERFQAVDCEPPRNGSDVPEPTQADYDRVRMLLTQLSQGGTQQQYQTVLAQLAETGPILLPILEQLVIAEGRPLHDAVCRQVLPGVDSLFGISSRLDHPDTGHRRAAVAELVNETKFGYVSPLLYRQLAAHAIREQDEIVLLRLWDFADRQAEKLSQLETERQVGHEPSDMAKQQKELMTRSRTQLRKSLTTGSLAHTSPELHHRACVHIYEYGLPDDVPMLLAEIRHPATSVSRAALQALARLGTIECARQVRPLLAHAQPLVVVDAALALDRWGDPAGQNAIERLAVSGDRTTKLAVVQGIKKNLDRKYIPLLIRLLDESGAIRQEALDALPLAAGHDVVPPQEMAFYSPQERIELWKQWITK